MKKFSGLMLNIKDMSEEDKLYYFLKELKPWARTKLQRQRVQDLATAQITVERLIDYATKFTQPKKAQPSASTSTSSGTKPWKSSQSKSGGADKKPTESNSSTPRALCRAGYAMGHTGLPNSRTSPSWVPYKPH